jgi:ribonuclease D
MEPEIGWITCTSQLASLLDGLGRQPLCLDTEADSMHHYPEKVCLIQLAVAGSSYLIDPLGDIDLRPLAPVLEDASRPKILHGADYDLRVLHRDFGLRISGLFDTMIAARLLGEPALGLSALLDRYLGVTLDKRFQRADWSRRPLPEAMMRYAALDTHYLETLADKLRRELQQAGREDWAGEEFRRLEQVRWSDAPDGEAYRRVKGSGALSRRGLAVLRELYNLREAEARRRDRPPFKILHNEMLVRLSSERPSNEEALAAMQGLPPAWRRGGKARRVLSAVVRAVELPEDQLPEKQARRRPVKGKRHEARLKKLSSERDAVARRLGIEPATLASRAVLERMVTRLEKGENPTTITDLRRWQAELLEPAVRRLGADSSWSAPRA